MSKSLWLLGVYHTRHFCPPLFPGGQSCPNSCPLSWWCYLTISSSTTPFFLPSIFSSNRVFSNDLVLLIRWMKYWSFSFSSNILTEYSGLISLRVDWFGVLAVQETLRSLLQKEFKSIWFSVLSLLYSQTFISIHNYWKKQKFDYANSCQQKWCLCFLMHCLDLSYLSFQKTSVF